MREELKTQLSGAGAALCTSATLAALRAGRLGGGLFSLQLAATLVVLSWAPYLHRTSLLSSLPRAVTYPLGATWFFLCLARVFVAFIVHLFTGHRVYGSSVFDALWRVYAILALWIGFAMLNERVIRPWWRENGSRFLGFARENSVGAEAKRIVMEKRTAALEAIKARVVVVLKKRKLAERTVERKKADIVAAREGIQEAEKMLVEANEREKHAPDEEKAAAAEEVAALKAKVKAAQASEKDIQDEMAQIDIELAEIKVKLDALQREWTEALHINNYTTTFFR